MKIAYFPGCCYETSAREYDVSTRAVCSHLGIELVEPYDWNCCGSTAAHSTDRLLALAMAARNLAQVEEMGLGEVTASCALCYQRLAITQAELAENEELLAEVNRLTGHSYRATVKVKPVLEIIAGLDEEELRARIVKPLSGFKIAAYYGCLLVRPSKIQVDDPENPQIMDKVMRLAGAETVDWTHKTECCGASLAISNEKIVVQMVARIIKAAALAGADCLVTACAMCHFNLDIRQGKVSRLLGKKYNLPVFYFTQLLGLAMGLSPKEVCVSTHFVDTRPLVKKII
ncbi:MAG: CoB--CoM heterodisulfide reductase iron-sulfur subunit B family protein [Desulfotomaculales bacterium]